MAFGTGPFGVDPFGLPILASTDPSLTPDTLSSSRAIDGTTGQYLTDAFGGFVAMDDVAQRVLLLVSYATVSTPYITPSDINAQRAAIYKALEILTKKPEPSIVILDVKIERIGTGKLRRTIEYRNLLTNTKASVSA